MPEHESSEHALATLTPEEQAVEASLRELLTLPSPSAELDARILAAARLEAVAARRSWRVTTWLRPLAAAAALLLSATILLPATAPRRTTWAPAENPLGISPLRGARVLSVAGALGHAGHPLRVGAWVDTGEPLVVRPDGHLLLGLPEGTELAFDGGTQATLRFDHQVRRIELARGRLYADVIKVGTTAEQRPIVLQTPAGEAKVLGTELTARASAASTRLTVRHGLVRLANHHGAAYVGASETGLLTGARRPQARRTATVDRHFRWIGKLQPGSYHPSEKAFGGGGAGEDEAAIGSLVARGPDGEPISLALAEQRFTTLVQGGVAHTTVRFEFRNDTDQRLEGTFRFALPKAASISRYAVRQRDGWVEGRVVERERARRIYAEQKRLLKEPALLEWAAGSAFQAQVFPIEAQATKLLEVSYVEELRERRGVSRLVLPLVSETSRLSPPERLRVTCRLLGSEARAALRCPSHHAELGWDGGARVVRLAADGLQPRNDFVLELGRSSAPALEATLEAGDSGAAAAALVRVRPDLSWLGDDVLPSRVVILADASRSQAGTLKEVQLELLEGLLAALPDRVRPRVFVHHVELEELASQGPDFDEGLLAALWHAEVGGASDLGRALRELGRRLGPDEGATLVYLGDGVATAGERDPAALRRTFAQALPTGAVRRLITVGVGADTDAALLEALARERDGVCVGVRPGDDLARKVDEAVSALTQPVLTQVVVDLGPHAQLVAPSAPGNLRDGETLSLSARVEAGVEALPVTVSGVVAGRTFEISQVVALQASAPGSLLVDLWARRRVGDLLLEGAARRDEVLDLALDHGIVTPYTSLVVLSPEEYGRYALEEQRRRAARELAKLAREAQTLAARGDLHGARAHTRALLERDPTNTDGRRVQRELDQLPGSGVEAQAPEDWALQSDPDLDLARAQRKPQQLVEDRREVAEGQLARLTDLTESLEQDLPALKLGTEVAGESGRRQVERPIVILEEEVEITGGVPRGTDLSSLVNKALDRASVRDAYGVGGGSSGGGVFAGRWQEDPAEEPADDVYGLPATGNEEVERGGLRAARTAEGLVREGDKDPDALVDYGELEELSGATLIDGVLGGGQPPQGYLFATLQQTAAGPTGGDRFFSAIRTRVQAVAIEVEGLRALVRALDAASPDARGPLFDRASGLCFALADQPQACLFLVRELLRYAPQDLDLHELAGRSYEALGLRRQAVRAYSGLVEAQPDDVHARLRYGLALERLGFLEQALAAFQAAIALDQGLPGARFALARLAVRGGRLDVAEAQLRALLARDYDSAEHGDVHAAARAGLRGLYRQAAAAWPAQAARYEAALRALGAD